MFKYNILLLLRNKSLLFWTLLFPIALSTLFHVAFANLEEGETFDTINVSVINFNPQDDLITLLEEVKFTETTLIFNISLDSKETSLDKLANGEVSGIIEFSDDNSIKLTVNSGGFNQTIIKTFLDRYLQTTSTVTSIMILTNGEADINEIIAELNVNQNYLVFDDSNTKKPNYVLTYFFSLIGMALIYGSFWGNHAVMTLLPIKNQHGVRLSIAPVKRFKQLLLSLLASFTIHIVEILIFLLYLMFVLGLNLNTNLSLLLLTCVVGSMVGISFGAFISMLLKRKSEGLKIAITVLVGTFGGFLSGMMIISVKYFIQTNAPFINYINPVGVITDALYSLNYYKTYERFIANMLILGIMTIVFLCSSLLMYRRDKYESI